MMQDTLIRLTLLTPVALIVYYLLPRRAQNAWLLIVSLLFCGLGGAPQVLIMVGMTIGNFAAALLIARSSKRVARAWLAIGITGNVLALAALKYTLVPRLLAALGGSELLHIDSAAVLVPLGLSFTVLQSVSYLVDVANGRLKATHDLIDFAVYMTYFPKLIAGPIERPQTFLSRLAALRIVDNDVVVRSFTLIVVGAVRKLVLADPLWNLIPPNLLTAPLAYSPLVRWVGLLAYAFVIYNDFAGYTSIVRGISGLFGLELSPNFENPYFARNFNEFWNRWHISFSHWLRDYLYFPISRWLARRVPNRRHPIHIVVPPLITMLISGVWHGASYHLLLWGALHGMYLMIRHVRLPSLSVLPPDKQPRWRQMVSALGVFMLVTLAWVLFYLPIPSALAYWQGLVSPGEWVRPPVMPIILIAATLLIDGLQAMKGNETVFLKWPRWAQTLALALALAAIGISLLDVPTMTTFIYQEF